MRVLASRHGLRGIALSSCSMESGPGADRAAGFDLHLAPASAYLGTLRTSMARLARAAGDGPPHLDLWPARTTRVAPLG